MTNRQVVDPVVDSCDIARRRANFVNLWCRSREIFPGTSRSSILLRFRFVSAGLRNRALVNHILQASSGSDLQRIIVERPQTLGLLVWPYQCASWEAPERLRRIISHHIETECFGAPLCFSTEERLVLADLQHLYAGARLVLDQPLWFLREGSLVLNLFLDEFRAFSLAFSLYRNPGGSLTAVIGALQGRNLEGALDIYRNLTKAIHGLRPRDLLMEVFRMLCIRINVEGIRAVANSARIHNHPYFKHAEILSQNYDQAWEERGGVRCDGSFYEIPLAVERRDLQGVKSGKRPMYRRRYQFLELLNSEITKVKDLSPIVFKDI